MMGKTYDINYKLNKHPDSLELVATVTEPVSGRILKAYTTEPGMQFYIPSSNMDYLNGHGNRKYGKYYGFCLEMQHFPDSPNNPQFTSTVLRPGEIYRQTTIYKFENSQQRNATSVSNPYLLRTESVSMSTEMPQWSFSNQSCILFLYWIKAHTPSTGFCGVYFTQKYSKVNNISMQKA